MRSSALKSRHNGFTLIEVVLALGVFFISILALIGLLAPMLRSVDEVEKIDEISSVVNTVNAYLQGSPDIAVDPKTKFDTIYEAIADDDSATVFVFRSYIGGGDESEIELVVGFYGEDTKESLTADDFNNVAGPIYRVVLTASSVTPESLRDPVVDDEDSSKISHYELNVDLANYPEGYLAMEARIYAEEWNPDFDPANLPPHGPDAVPFTLDNLMDFEPDFTFNTAIVR